MSQAQRTWQAQRTLQAQRMSQLAVRTQAARTAQAYPLRAPLVQRRLAEPTAVRTTSLSDL